MTIRDVAIALTALAVGSAPVAVFVSVTQQPLPGVIVSADSTRVTSVVPGGPAWNEGIRAGQAVREIAHGPHGGDWRLVVTDASGVDYASTAEGHRASLRATAPAAGGALILTVASAIAARRRMWTMAGAMASIAIALASWPILTSAQPILAEAAAVVGMGAPAAWLAFGQPRPAFRYGLLALVAAIAVTWLAGRLAFSSLYAPAELARVLLLGAAVGTLAIGSIEWRPWSRSTALLDTSRSNELAGMAAVAIVVAVAGVFLDIPLWLAGGVAAGAAIAYPPMRGHAARLFDRLVLSEEREKARIAAVERERVRLAFEIHDVPLQEIAGVIRRLERVVGANTEADLLRGVAQNLRDITAELHPPVLKDLGLAPALVAAVEDADRLGPHTVTSQLRDGTGVLSGQRPPGDVELAIYRIVHEAITNARIHGNATAVTVIGDISPSSIAVTVYDDGDGIDLAALRAAQRDGHFGITSMGQRADAIGAELRIELGDPGTQVSVVWRRG